jgi:hypothetical protein
MAKKGLIFLMNELPLENETFLVRKKFRFIPEFSRPVKTIIELEIYESNICLISFYSKKNGSEKNRYRLRTKLGVGQALSIFKACLKAYYSLNMDYAFVFCASNDVGEIMEDNSRYSAYILFLSRYFTNFKEYDQQGSISLNTLMLYHHSFQYKKEADIFYENFKEIVLKSLSEDSNQKY